MRWQRRDDIDNLETVSDTTAESSNIVGVLTTVTPMKRGKRASFFEAKLTDGQKSMRVVCFQPNQQDRLRRLKETKDSVALVGCEVKKSRFSEELKAVLKTSSQINSSPEKFKLGDVGEEDSNIKLKSLAKKNNFEKVTLNVKVLRVEDVAKVSGNLKKQDITIADDTAAERLTLWEGDVGRMEEDECYRLCNIVVRSYQGVKYLSFPKAGADMTTIGDIGDVVVDDLAEDFTTVDGAVVIGVLTLDSYLASIVCKSKVSTIN